MGAGLQRNVQGGGKDVAPVVEDVVEGPLQAAVEAPLGHLQAGVQVSARVGGLQNPQVVLHGADQVRQVHGRRCSAPSDTNYYYFYYSIITRYSWLEARCICRQAAVKAAKNLPIVGLTRSKQDPINRGHGAQNLYRAPPAGANNTSSDTQ